MAHPWNRLTDRAKRAVALAGSEAIRLRQPTVGPEHLLVGSLGCGDTVAARVLVSSGVELSKARKAVEAATGTGEAPEARDGIWPSGETKEIVQLAADEAERMGISDVRPEHLLLALLRAPGSAAAVLRALGVSSDTTRQAILAESDSGD